jgi:hypothetical protein
VSHDLKVGYQSGDTEIRRSIIKFDLSGIINGSSPQSATLSLHCTLVAGSVSIDVRRIIQTQDFTSGATWNKYDGSVAWTTPGGSLGSSKYAVATQSCPTPAWKDWNVLPLVNQFLNGTYPNHGFGLREDSSTENVNQLLTFDSSETGSSTAPKLTVVTDPNPAGLEGGGFQNVLAVDPANGQDVVSGGDDAGVNISTDGGQSWVPSNLITDSVNTSLGPDLKVAAFDWVSDAELYSLVGSVNPTTGAPSGGVMLSIDHGTSWTMLSNGGFPIFGNGGDGTTADGLSSQFPRSTGNLLTTDSTGTYIYVGTYDQGIYRGKISTLTGSTPEWTAIGLQPSGGQNLYIRSIAVDPANDCLFASTYQGTSGSSSTADGHVWRIRHANDDSLRQTAQQMTGSEVNTEEIIDFNSTLYGVVYESGGNANNGLWRLASASSVGTTVGWTKDTNLHTSSTPSNDPTWYSLTGYSPSSSSVTLWIGGAHPSSSTSFTDLVYKIKTTNAWSTETSTAYPSSGVTHPEDVGGQPGDLSHRAWWMNQADPRNVLGGAPTPPGGGSLFAASQVVIDPTDSTHNTIYVAGKSGVWKTNNGGADWYPYVRKLGATINRAIAVDPNAEDSVFVGNTDYGILNSINDMNSVAATINQVTTLFPTSGLSVAVDPTATPTSTVYLGIGQHDTNTNGDILVNTDIAGGGGWTSLGLTTSPSGLRPIGLLAAHSATHTYVLAAVQDGGIYERTDTGSFTQVTGLGAPPMTGESTKSAIFAWNPGSSNVYLYDRAGGVWRGSNYGTGQWTEILIQASNTERTGYIATDPTNNSVVYISNGTGVYEATNADTADPGGGVNLSKTQIGSTYITNPGAISVAASGGYLFVCDRATVSGQAKLWRASLANLTTSWTDVATSAYRGAALFPLSMATNSAGDHIYIATDGDGVVTEDLS